MRARLQPCLRDRKKRRLIFINEINQFSFLVFDAPTVPLEEGQEFY